jgi:hypothetical protein
MGRQYSKNKNNKNPRRKKTKKNRFPPQEEQVNQEEEKQGEQVNQEEEKQPEEQPEEKQEEVNPFNEVPSNNSSNLQNTTKKQKRLGFTETLKRKTKITNNLPLNINTCPNIFKNGSKVNTKFFYPSEFPNLTKIKPIPGLKKNAEKVGGKISRKYKHSINRKKSKRKY